MPFINNGTAREIIHVILVDAVEPEVATESQRAAASNWGSPADILTGGYSALVCTVTEAFVILGRLYLDTENKHLIGHI
jgi:hypothetical protein